MRKPNLQKTQQNDVKSQLLQQASEVEKFFKECTVSATHHGIPTQRRSESL